MAEPPSAHVQKLGYEPEDANPRWVVGTAIAGSIFVLVAAAVLYALPTLFERMGPVVGGPPPSALERRAPTPPPPRLQSLPSQHLATYRAHEALVLNGYAWIDAERGIARIPIDRAMSLLAERGWPQPATGPRPQPEATERLAPWPDWKAEGSGGAGAIDTERGGSGR